MLSEGTLRIIVRSTTAALLMAPATAVAMTAEPVRATAADDGQVICLEDSDSTGGCHTRAWAEQDGDGVMQVTLAAGSGQAEQCWRSPPHTIADGSEGPEWVACNGGSKGWYSQHYDCYFTADNEGARHKDPSDDDIIYPDGVRHGDEGTVHIARCYFEHYSEIDGWFLFNYWFLPPSEEPGPTLDPTAELIVEALDQLELAAPTIGTAPPSSGVGLVRLPVWLWNETTEENWGTRTAQAGAAGITARATAQATGMTWDMGDDNEVHCDEGAAWEPGMDTLHPPCGHTYEQASRHRAEGTYLVTAEATWEVEWSVNGPNARSGTVALRPWATTELEITEIQVLTGDG